MQGLRQTGSRQPGGIFFRASAYAGSAADYATSQPRPPLSDAIIGVRDPTRFDLLRAFTKRTQLFYTLQNQDNLPSTWNAASIDYLKEQEFTYSDISYLNLIYSRLGLGS
jgi:hypothetical protein